MNGSAIVSQKKPLTRFAVIAVTMVISSGACTPDTDASQSRLSDEQPRTFSSENKRIARALSLGGEVDGGARGSTVEAASCVIALNFIRLRLGGSVGLNSEHTIALDKAITLYRTRAGANTMPSNQFAEKLKTAESSMPNAADQARASLRCLQALE